MGMHPDPMQSYAIHDRVSCAKCGGSPQIQNPEKIEAGSTFTITVECHGERETRLITREEFLKTVAFFTGNVRDHGSTFAVNRVR